MAAQVSPASTQRSELDVLTLDHILSDLDGLSPNAALLGLASSTTPSTAQAATSRDSKDLLTSFESNTLPASNTAISSAQRRKDYVALSHELLASFQNAQRLNTEQVSADQVGLLLPSERNRNGLSSSSTNTASGSRSSDASARAKALGTRTDLLHAKVADLQTQVDAWDTALEHAVKLADGPIRKRRGGAEDVERLEAAGTEAREAVRPPASGQAIHADETASEDPIPAASNAPDLSSGASGSERTSRPAGSEAPTAVPDTDPVDQGFQDDDPWNDLA